MSSFDDSKDADSDDEHQDEFAAESPIKEEDRTSLSSTGIGQSLLELVNSNELDLSPTSRDIKRLSAEVFGL
jgi:hypothetical protein